MKTTLLFALFVILFSSHVFSQAPQSFRYQAIARNAQGDVIPGQQVSFRISLMQGSVTGTAVYSEEHTVTTNLFGLVNLNIGSGSNAIGSFSAIDWSTGPYFIKIEIDVTGSTNYIDLGASQLLSVPYALFAASGNQGPQGIQGNPGTDGANGQDGIGISSTYVMNDSLYITLSNGNTLNAGHVTGSQGIQGIQGDAGSNGISVTGSYIQNDSLMITLTDSTTINAGHVRGAQGLAGPQGPAGTGLNNRGAWVNGTVYNTSDYVFDRSTNDANVNSMWICQAAVSFTSATNPYLDQANWVEFQAPAGQPGVQGIQGPQGIQGEQGIQGIQGPQGIPGTNGISLTWLGSYTTAPADPVLNESYYNSTDKKSYIWDGYSWQVLVQDGADGANGTNGINGLQGPQGEQGLQGIQGIPGTDGISITWLGTLAVVPTSPSMNQAYYNSTDKISYIFDGSSWQVLAQDGATGTQGIQGVQGDQGLQGTAGTNGISVFWLGSYSSAPAAPTLNQAYYNTTDKKSYIFDGGNWQVLAQDGADGVQGVQGVQGNAGADGINGISITWLGTSDIVPLAPALNQAYYNSTDKKSYIFDGGNWQVLAQDGADGMQGPQGIQGISGTNGTNGYSILNGVSDPIAEGANGDFYINTTTNQVFGPKTAGSWGTGTSLIGPQGIQGLQGPAGTGLTNRGTWLTGTSYSNGDYVFDRSTGNPSVNSMWICQTGAFTSGIQPYQDAAHWVEFQAPAGPQGPQGVQGIQGPPGTYVAGTGISLTGGTITNSMPDQAVTLTGSGATSITGAYPNFTISSTDNNTSYSAGTGLTLTGTTFSANFGSTSTTIAQGNHTHSQLHNQGHAMTSATDHTAGNWKLFYSNGSGNVTELGFGTPGQVLSSTGFSTAPSWTTPVTGTVTSVGLSLPSVFSVSGSPVTSSGTLTASFNTQTANYVFAGPSSGAAAAPTFRALVASDIPVHNNTWPTITGTPTTLAGYGITDGVPSGRTLSITGTANQVNLSAGTQDLSANRTWTVSIASNAILPGTSSVTVPLGTTVQRPVTATNGMIRFNSTTSKFEFYENGIWVNFTSNASGLVSGAANYIPKFDSNANLDTSLMYQNGKKIGVGTTTPSGRFMIQQDAGAADTEPIFEVKDKSGQTVMVIYKDSTHFFVKDPGGAKTDTRGSFAVSGKSSVKSFTNNYLLINPDSTRIYTSDTIAGFGVKNIQSASTGNYLKLNPKNYLVGHDAGKSLTTGKYNFIAGYQSAKSLTTGNNNTYIGYQSAFSDLQGFANVFVGYKSGYSNIGGKVMNLPVGYQNTYIGNEAGFSNTQGINNTFIGNEAGFNNVGTFSAIYEAYTGSWNVFVGDQAGYNNVSSSHNLFAGMQAGYNSTAGNNVFLGAYAGRDNTTGQWNVLIGTSAGWNNGGGGGNVFIGNDAGQNNNGGSNNIFIGYRAGSYASGSNKFIINNANGDSTNSFMYGCMYSGMGYTKYLRFNEKVGVNTHPAYMVHSVDNSVSSDNAAVFGSHEVTEGFGIGVEGRGNYRGIKGYCSSNYSGTIAGGYLYGYNSGTGNTYGTYSYAYASSGTSYGVYSSASSGGTSYAGYFSGNVHVTGTLSKGGGSFQIDHPLDPENKYLYHSFVESPDMKNIYDGVVTLDETGKASVTLPDWFEAVNNEFRYQLTSIGAPGPNLFISKEISGNNFEISGGTPGMKVSWMVTGIRKDPFAQKNRIPVEVDKAAEDKGFYLYPDAYGLPAAKGIDAKHEEKRKDR